MILVPWSPQVSALIGTSDDAQYADSSKLCRASSAPLPAPPRLLPLSAPREGRLIAGRAGVLVWGGWGDVRACMAERRLVHGPLLRVILHRGWLLHPQHRSASHTHLCNAAPHTHHPHPHPSSRVRSRRTVLYSTLLYSTLLYSTLLYSALLYSTLLYSALLCSTLLYSTLLCCSTVLARRR